MPANPFYIQPAGDFGPQLTGLAGVVGEIGEKKRAEEKEQSEIARIDKIKKGALDIMENGTEEDMRKYVVNNPEIGPAVKAATEIKFPGASSSLGDAYYAASIDPTKTGGVFQAMNDQFSSDGVITQEESEQMQEFQTMLADDPDKAQDMVKKGLYLFGTKDQLKRYKDMQGGSESYEGLTGAYKNWLIANDKESSPENFKLFQKNKVQLAADMRKQSVARPNVARLMADGWVPSSRITEPMMDSYEAAAAKAEADGKPLSVQDLYNYEFNAQKNRATGRTAGGRLTLSRKQNIESGRELLNEMKVTAKKLDFSNVKMIGAFEKFKKGQLSDPNFAEYMAQRADALFVITAAMKMNGVTDKAIEIEEEAFPVNSSPRVFNAWFNTQMRALNRAGKEMDKDFKYGIEEIPTFPPGQGGAPTEENPVPTIESDVPAANKSDEELKESLGL